MVTTWDLLFCKYHKWPTKPLLIIWMMILQRYHLTLPQLLIFRNFFFLIFILIFLSYDIFAFLNPYEYKFSWDNGKFATHFVENERVVFFLLFFSCFTSLYSLCWLKELNQVLAIMQIISFNHFNCAFRSSFLWTQLSNCHLYIIVVTSSQNSPSIMHISCLFLLYVPSGKWIKQYWACKIWLIG